MRFIVCSSCTMLTEIPNSKVLIGTVFGTMDRIMNVVVVMDPGVLASRS